MATEPQKFDMVELRSGKKVVATEISNRLFLAFNPDPISAVFDEDYVKRFRGALSDKDNRNKIFEWAGSKRQLFIRLEAIKTKQPWWAPITVSKIPTNLGPDNILVTLLKNPIRINYY